MARVESGDRTILEPLTEVDLSRVPGFSSSSSSPSVRSLAICSTSSTEISIYAGTDSGIVFFFVVDPSQQESPEPIDIYTRCKISSPKWIQVGNSPVESLIVVTEVGRVIALSEGFLHVFNMNLSQPIEKLGFLKGVSCIARKLSFAEAEAGDARVEDFSKKLFHGRSRVHEKAHPQIAVCANRKLIFCEIRPGVNRHINGSSRIHDFGGFSVSVFREIQNMGNVSTMEWIDDSVIVGTANAYSLLSCATGQSSTIFTLPESSGPPLLKAMRRRKEVLLMVDNVGILSDAFGQPVGGSLILRHVPQTLRQISMYIVVAGEGKLDLHHGRSGLLVQSVELQGQTSELLVIADEERGIEQFLACATSGKVFLFRQISAEEQIKDLLRKKNLQEAVSLLEEFKTEGCLSNEMVSFVHAQIGFVLLFDLQFAEAVNHFLQSDTMQPSEIFPFIMRDPNRWSSLVPRNRYWQLHSPPIPLEEVVDNGLVAIQRGVFLRKAGVDIGSDEGFLSNPPSRAELLESAIHNIIRYLKVSRDKDLTTQLKEGVDTLLMYLFRALDLSDDMEQLASSTNSCAVEELESLLEDSGHLRTLAFLYASKGKYSKALNVWRVLSGKHLSSSWKDATSNRDLQSGLASCSPMDAAKQASCLLEVSSDKNIILQHLGWVAEVDEELAIKVLTSEKRITPVPPEEVLATIDAKKVDVIQRYLQWLIEEQGTVDGQFHTLYALSLAKSVINAVQSDGAKHKTSNSELPHAFDISDPDSIQNSTSSIRKKLQFFLDFSCLYDVDAILDLLEESDLWLEKAILHRKLEHEALVLQILALKLEDSEAAERYCVEIGRPDAYMQLLDIYLEPQNGKEPMLHAAVRLLHNHGECLDPLQVLEKLTPDMPLQLASDTLLRMLRARVHHFRQGQIAYNLSRAINIDTRLSRFEEISRHVQINDESVCDSCHTRLGTKLFAMYPDDSVVCYRCFRRNPEHISPVNGHDFHLDFVTRPGWLVKRP